MAMPTHRATTARYAQYILNTGRGFFVVGSWPEFSQSLVGRRQLVQCWREGVADKNRGYWRPGARACVEIQLLWTGGGYLARRSIIAPARERARRRTLIIA